VQGLLTKGERSLIRDGKQELVLETRRAYQQTMGADLTAGIEEITGRQVIAFLSANNLDPDLAIESFMLAPKNGQPPPTEKHTRLKPRSTAPLLLGTTGIVASWPRCREGQLGLRSYPAPTLWSCAGGR
jgi:hypothetical protein